MPVSPHGEERAFFLIQSIDEDALSFMAKDMGIFFYWSSYNPTTLRKEPVYVTGH
jgi:hypothetical protein